MAEIKHLYRWCHSAKRRVKVKVGDRVEEQVVEVIPYCINVLKVNDGIGILIEDFTRGKRRVVYIPPVGEKVRVHKLPKYLFEKIKGLDEFIEVL